MQRSPSYARLKKAVALMVYGADGKPFVIPPSRYVADVLLPNVISQSNAYEPFMDRPYRAALAVKSGAFVDVGTNTGQTLLKVLAIDRNIKYIGFEPQLDCAHAIERFIRLNKLASHSILPIGLSNMTGAVTLLKRDEAADSTASTVPGFRPDAFYRSKAIIFVARGDDAFDALRPGPISVLKIDVEGAELEVMEGFAQTIQRDRPIIFFEILNHFLAATGEAISEELVSFRDNRNQQIRDLLRSAGYRIFNIRKSELREIRDFVPEYTADQSITNYVAVHEETAAAYVAAHGSGVLEKH